MLTYNSELYVSILRGPPLGLLGLLGRMSLRYAANQECQVGILKEVRWHSWRCSHSRVPRGLIKSANTRTEFVAYLSEECQGGQVGHALAHMKNSLITLSYILEEKI